MCWGNAAGPWFLEGKPGLLVLKMVAMGGGRLAAGSSGEWQAYKPALSVHVLAYKMAGACSVPVPSFGDWD